MLHSPIGLREVLLIAGVSLQATVLAYVYDPTWKAILYGLPIPFTLSTLAIQRPVDATNVLGLILLLLFTHGIRLLHNALKINIILSIAICAVGYCVLGYGLVQIVPSSALAFRISCVLVFILGAVMHVILPTKTEPGHRSLLPVWLKLPVIVIVVVMLMLIKNSLHGFTTVFPMVGVIGAYESRHSLWTLGRQIPVLIMTLIPLMVASHLLCARLGLAASLGIGWIVFLAILIPLTRLSLTSTSMTTDA